MPVIQPTIITQEDGGPDSFLGGRGLTTYRAVVDHCKTAVTTNNITSGRNTYSYIFGQPHYVTTSNGFLIIFDFNTSNSTSLVFHSFTLPTTCTIERQLTESGDIPPGHYKGMGILKLQPGDSSQSYHYLYQLLSSNNNTPGIVDFELTITADENETTYTYTFPDAGEIVYALSSSSSTTQYVGVIPLWLTNA